MKATMRVMYCLMACVLSVRGAGSDTHALPRDSCASCGLGRPDVPDAIDTDFLEAVKRHILSRLQMRERPNITHPIPKAAMVTALRKLHAGKVREDGRFEIPSLDGQAAYSNEAPEETSEIISFAESGVCEIYNCSKTGFDTDLDTVKTGMTFSEIILR